MDFERLIRDFVALVLRMHVAFFAAFVAIVLGAVAWVLIAIFFASVLGADYVVGLVTSGASVIGTLAYGVSRYNDKPRRADETSAWVTNLTAFMVPVAGVCGLVGGLIVLSIGLSPGRPRGFARRSSCQSNLKQIMLGVTQYVQDYDRFPLQNSGSTVTTGGPSGFVCDLQPYLKSTGIFQCPQAPHMSVTPGKTDYAYNSGVLAGSPPQASRHLSSTVVLTECNEMDGSLASASAPLVSNRHLDGSNYVFVDGHVKWFASLQAPAAANIGATHNIFSFGS